MAGVNWLSFFNYGDDMKQLLFSILLLLVFTLFSFAQDSQSVKNELSTEEKEALKYMVQEEKLAHDTYQLFAASFDIPVFANITQSEQRHMDAVLNLIKMHDLDDPTEGKSTGQFENRSLQTLYDSLKNSKNDIINALLAGALIEETDIKDLLDKIAMTHDENIKVVFNNLLQGSYNHIRAFTRNLQMRGVTYKPEILDEDAYAAVISSDRRTRGQGRGNCKRSFND